MLKKVWQRTYTVTVIKNLNSNYRLPQQQRSLFPDGLLHLNYTPQMCNPQKGVVQTRVVAASLEKLVRAFDVEDDELQGELHEVQVTPVDTER